MDGNLNLSRSIGDLKYKREKFLKPQDQPITAFPEVRKRELTKGCDFMILACDGIWEGKSSQEVVDFVYAKLKKHPLKLSSVIEDLFNELVSPNFVTTGKSPLTFSGCRMRQHDLCYRPVQIFLLISLSKLLIHSILLRLPHPHTSVE